MFNVSRPATQPECSKKTGYNTAAIVLELENIFLGKCYLCEQSKLTDPEIEHFIPHQNDDSLKYNWHNLYYACSRCNSIKGARHINLLDCCDPETDVFKKIRIVLPTIPSDEIRVQAQDPSDAKSVNTAILLDKCYNDQTTGLRGITRNALMEKLQEEYLYLLTEVQAAIHQRSTQTEVRLALEKIKVMLGCDYPFSAIWKWYVMGHTALLKRLPDLALTASLTSPQTDKHISNPT